MAGLEEGKQFNQIRATLVVLSVVLSSIIVCLPSYSKADDATASASLSDSNGLLPPRDFQAWVGSDCVILNWKSSYEQNNTAVQYEVLRGRTSGALTSLKILDWSTNDYTDEDVEERTTYYYAIRTIIQSSASPTTTVHMVTTRYDGMNEAWSKSIVDTYQSAGWWPSMKIDYVGKAHICYENLWDGSFRYATNENGHWDIEEIEGTNSFSGDRCSLAIDSNNVVHLAYRLVPPQDLSSSYLYHAWKEGGSWQKELVDDSGEYPSMAFDSWGNAHISYFCDDEKSVKLASKLNGTWSTRTIFSDMGFGGNTKIAIDDHDNKHIVFVDTHYSQPQADVFEYALVSQDGLTLSKIRAGQAYLDSFDLAVNNNKPYVVYDIEGSLYLGTLSNGTWNQRLIIQMTKTSDGYIGSNPSIAFNGRGALCISYADISSCMLRFAVYYYGFSSANRVIDGAYDTGSFSSIAVDESGRLYVAYLDFSGKDLKMAQARFGEPSEVTDLIVTPGDGKVTISYKPPNETGGMAPAFFYVYRSTSPDTDSMAYIGECIWNQTEYVDTNVTNNQTYYYTVIPDSPFGRGAASNILSATPNIRQAGGPISMEYLLIGTAAIIALVGGTYWFVRKRGGDKK